MTLQPLVTVLGGVAEVFHGDMLIIDWDDWNDSDTTADQRQDMIDSIQAAGYRCVVSGEPGENIPEIRIFRPDQEYAYYISEDIPDNHEFAVYDPKEIA